MLPGELSRPTTVVGKRVLIVDDDSDALELLHCVLESRDLEVYDAADAAEALEWVGSVDFDLIISDIEMPGCNGYELLREVSSCVSKPVVRRWRRSKPMPSKRSRAAESKLPNTAHVKQAMPNRQA